MRRRAFLATTAASFVPLAGCGSDGTGGTPRDNGEPLSEAAIASDLSAQPHLGPGPTDAESVIIDVSDPSCPTCESHHAGAFGRIRSELVEAGSTAYVVRNVDFVYPWGTQASKALEATHERAPGVYWDLLDFYFDNQGSISTDNVLDRTESFLADTAVDGAATVADVESGAADAALAADVDTARTAGVSGVPTFFLFRDGRLRTSFSGPQSYSVFQSALGY